MAFDREKFKTLVHYVIWKAGDRDGFGAVKLNKVLWFSEARMYMLHGVSITGATYMREKYGPVPRDIMPIRRELVEESAVKIWRDRHYDHPATRFKALRSPDTKRLSSKERQVVDWWIKHIDEEHTAASISEQSHDYAWEIAQIGEELPLHALFANRLREPKDDELLWAKAQAEKLGLP